jgi:hypothetical protein
MRVRFAEIWNNGWPVIAGVAIAAVTLLIFQLLSPLAFDPYERVNPFAYSEQVEHFRPKQIRNELLGMALGVFTGVLLMVLLNRKLTLMRANLVPVILLFFISTTHWHFNLAIELIWLVLPVWVLISFIAFHTGQFILARRSRGNTKIVKS